VSTNTRFTLTWARPSTYPKGVRYTVFASRNGGAWKPLVNGLSGSKYTVHAAKGSTYEFLVQPVRQGNPGATGRTVRTVVPYDDGVPAVSYSGAWSRQHNVRRFGATGHLATRSGATFTFRSPAPGTRLWLIGDKGPTFGRFQVKVDGGQWSRWFDAAAARHKFRAVLWSSGMLTPARHTLTVRIEGTPRRPAVVTDAIALLR
jgi:hypothetical protein